MANSQIVRVDALRSLAFGSISGTYAALGTAFGHPMRLIKIQNLSNANVTVSFDGITDNDLIPSNGFALYDLTTNRASPDTTFAFSNGTQVYVKGSPSSGSVYLTAIYGQGD